MGPDLKPEDSACIYVQAIPAHLLESEDWADCLKPIIKVLYDHHERGYAWRKEMTYQFATSQEICEAIDAGLIALDFVCNDEGYPIALRVMDKPVAE